MRLQDEIRHAGFRRVELVRVSFEGAAAVASVTGVVHRYPRTVRVPLSVASRLIAAGAPVALGHTASTTSTHERRPRLAAR